MHAALLIVSLERYAYELAALFLCAQVASYFVMSFYHIQQVLSVFFPPLLHAKIIHH